MRTTAFTLLVVLTLSVGFAQDRDSLSTSAPVDSGAAAAAAPVDARLSNQPVLLTPGNKRITTPDSAARFDSLRFHPTKTPMLALGLSAALPGAGQIYNGDYWKVPVVWGLGGYWVYEWVRNNNQYQDYREQYLQSLKDIPPYGNGRYLQLRDFYRDERDKFAWYLGVLYFANLLDAYVSAHLYDFDVTPDLSSVSRPGAPPSMGLTLRYNLHHRGR